MFRSGASLCVGRFGWAFSTRRATFKVGGLFARFGRIDAVVAAGPAWLFQLSPAIARCCSNAAKDKPSTIWRLFNSNGNHIDLRNTIKLWTGPAHQYVPSAQRRAPKEAIHACYSVPPPRLLTLARYSLAHPGGWNSSIEKKSLSGFALHISIRR